MNQVIITGASGLLGSQLVQIFKDQGREVVAVFNKKQDLIMADVKKVQCDISDRKAVLSLGDHIQPESLIIHCAAITNVDLCEKERGLCKAVNIDGTLNICDLARRMGSKLVFISTSSVFDGKTGNYRELDQTNPVNYYNFSKIEGENHIFKYEKGLVIRTTPLGLHLAGREPSSFLEWLIASFKNNVDINLFNDIKINPLSVSTAADTVVKASMLMNGGLLHLGSRDVVSKAEIGFEVAKLFPEYTGEISVIGLNENKQQLTSRPKGMWLNVDKALSMGFELPEALSDINKYLITRLS